jgi:tetratricopeptide (TPR) repeat protein
LGVKYRLIYLLLLSQLLNVGFLQSVSLANPTNVSDRRATNHQTKASFLERQGRAFYESGQLQKAISLFQQAISVYQNEGDIVGEAIVLSNLALVYQQLGSLSQAEQAISTSIELLEGDRNSAATQPILAQVLEIQGKLLFSKGQSQQALTAWERSSAIFSQLEDREGIVRSRINQAQALQSLGFYRKAIDTLEPIVESLKQQGESLTQVIALRNLGDALQVVGEVKRAGEILQQSLAIAERLKLEEEIAASQLSLANVLRALGESETAMTLYQQAADRSSQEIVQTQALLNQLSLSIENRQYSAAEAILPQIQINLNKLPVNRSAIYARINFAQSIMNLEREGKKIACTTTECQPAYILATAVREARILKNGRTEAYALGKLAAAYELAQQESSAEKLTQQALDLAQTNNASDIAYELHWQRRSHRDRSAARPASESRTRSFKGDRTFSSQRLRNCCRR